MKKTTSKALASAALTALIAGIIPAHQVSAANTEFQRLSGKDRYLTAVEVSKAGWAEGADYAIVANGEAYADALSAGPFAKKNNAPVLLTSSKGITNETISELKRLKVKKVYVIGETGVVPNSILETIKKNVTTDVERIGGSDRYATSTKIAEKFGTVNEAMLASGEGYADALSAVPAAAIKGIPVLLTKSRELPKSTSDYIKAQGLKRTFVIGGTASVNDTIKGQVPNAVRLGGKNRFETNAEIIKSFALDFNFDRAYIALANGAKEFADALTASALAAKGGHPVIISNKTADAATTAIINEKVSPTTKITAVGGTANLSDSLMKSYQIKGETIEASKDITGNVVVSKDNVELKDMKVTGNLYLEGNNAELNNVTVNGTVFVNPGKEGSAKLNNVTADKIVVLSGSNESIHLNNVTCNTLYVSSKTQTKIILEGTANIKNVEIFSSAIIDAKNEFKGTIVVLDNLYVNNVEFLGKYSGTITVKDKNDSVKLPEGSTLPGGGGGGAGGAGGGGGSIATDPLQDKITIFTNAYDKFKNNPQYEDSRKDYPAVSYNNKELTVKINQNKEGLKPSKTFDNKKASITAQRLEKLNILMAGAGVNVTVGDKTLTLMEYITSRQAFVNYMDGEKIKYEAIADRLASEEFSFEYAESVVNRLIKPKLQTKVPTAKVGGLTLQSISKDYGKPITLSGNTYGQLDKDLKGMFKLGEGDSYAGLTYHDLAGTYSLTFEEGTKTVTYKIVVEFN